MLKIAWEKFDELVKLLHGEQIEYKGLYYSKKIGIKRMVVELKDYELK